MEGSMIRSCKRGMLVLVLCTVLIDRPAAAAVTLKFCEALSETCLAAMPAACMIDGFTVVTDKKARGPYNGDDFIMLPVRTTTPTGDDCSGAWYYDYDEYIRKLSGGSGTIMPTFDHTMLNMTIAGTTGSCWFTFAVSGGSILGVGSKDVPGECKPSNISSPSASPAPGASPGGPVVPSVHTLRVGLIDGGTTVNNFPYVYAAEDGGPLTGFDVALVETVCADMGATCNTTTYGSQEEVLQALEAANIDLAVGSLPITPANSGRVDFVHPPYATVGLTVFAPEGVQTNGWATLEQQKYCIVEGTTITESSIPSTATKVRVANLEEAYNKVKPAQGDPQCAFVVADSSLPFIADPEVGFISAQQAANPPSSFLMRVAGADPKALAPVAAAVGKGNIALEKAVSAALVQLMKDGDNSAILELQTQYLAPGGLADNAGTAAVVDAVTSAGV